MKNNKQLIKSMEQCMLFVNEQGKRDLMHIAKVMGVEAAVGKCRDLRLIDEQIDEPKKWKKWKKWKKNMTGGGKEAHKLAAELLVGKKRQLTEDESDELIDELMDLYEEYEDWDNDDLEALNKRKVATLILEKVMKKSAARPQLLGMEYLRGDDDEQPAKRQRVVEPTRPSDREQVRKDLSINTERLEGCSQGVSLRSNSYNIFVDFSLSESEQEQYIISIPQDEWRRFATLQVFVELLNTMNGRRVYAKIDGGHARGADNVYVSNAVYKLLIGEESIRKVYIRTCSGAPRIKGIDFVAFGEIEYDANDVKDIVGLMPAISRGTELIINNGDTVLVAEKIIDENDDSIFIGELFRTFEDRDIIFGFRPYSDSDSNGR